MFFLLTIDSLTPRQQYSFIHTHNIIRPCSSFQSSSSSSSSSKQNLIKALENALMKFSSASNSCFVIQINTNKQTSKHTNFFPYILCSLSLSLSIFKYIFFLYFNRNKNRVLSTTGQP